MKKPNNNLFKNKLEELKANKEQIYTLMKEQASDPDTIAYYEQQAKELGDVDLEILDSEEIDETSYLLNNPNNAKFLKESIKEVNQGKTIAYTVDELKNSFLNNE